MSTKQGTRNQSKDGRYRHVYVANADGSVTTYSLDRHLGYVTTRTSTQDDKTWNYQGGSMIDLFNELWGQAKDLQEAA